MQLSEYVAKPRGRIKHLAELLGVSGSLITQWAGGKPVSFERCMPIELATGGEVRRWDLRPDDWWQHWPELIGTDGAPPVPDAQPQAA